MLFRYFKALGIYYFTPIFFKITDIKHQFVKPDCNKLAPTKAVNQIQLGFT